jgi:hypothetical protein
VVSHPCARKKAQGWGTEFLAESNKKATADPAAFPKTQLHGCRSF